MKQTRSDQEAESASNTSVKIKMYSHVVELKQLVADLKKGMIEDSELAILRKTLIKILSADIEQIPNKSRKKNIIIDYIAAIVGKEYSMDTLELEKEIRHFIRSLEKK